MKLAIDDAITRMREVGDAPAMTSLAQRADEVDVDQLARLVEVLAYSGEVVGPISSSVVDIASTGGPGSLSTLLAPLFVRGLGGVISKIAVPGRPAGGLDSLASLPRYRTDVDVRSARHVLEACDYLHVAAGTTFCPLDAAFFTWRQANGAQAVPNLAIASLLAKKVAAGAGRVVLDVRVGTHGNFGHNLDEARLHAARFIAVARELGITAACILSDALAPAQPWVGRGEALVAVADVLTGADTGLLSSHATDCFLMATIAIGRDGEASTPPEIREVARAAHDRMLDAHGASGDSYWSRVEDLRRGAREQIRAEKAGRVHIDIQGVRSVLVEHQSSAHPLPGATFSDPCGLRFNVDAGGLVQEGDVIAEVRDDGSTGLAHQLEVHVSVTEPSTHGKDEGKSTLEVVRE